MHGGTVFFLKITNKKKNTRKETVPPCLTSLSLKRKYVLPFHLVLIKGCDKHDNMFNLNIKSDNFFFFPCCKWKTSNSLFFCQAFQKLLVFLKKKQPTKGFFFYSTPIGEKKSVHSVIFKNHLSKFENWHRPKHFFRMESFFFSWMEKKNYKIDYITHGK